MKRIVCIAALVSCTPTPVPPVETGRPSGGATAAASAADVATEPAAPAIPRFVLQTGHVLPVNDVAWSPDGSTLATAGGDGLVKVWDAATGVVRATLVAGSRGAWSVAWNRRGDRLAAASANGTIHVWNVGTSALLFVAETGGSAASVTWSPDGTRIATGVSGGSVQVWNASTGERLHVWTGHTGAVEGVAWSPDGSTIASAGVDGTVRTWTSETGTPGRTFAGPGPALQRVAWSPDGSRIAAGGRGPRVRVWDARTGAVVQTLEGHTRAAPSVAWSPDGRTLATGGWDRAVHLWDASTGASSRTLEGHEGFVGAVAFSPDGTRLASGSADDTVRLWDLRAGASALSLVGEGERVTGVRFADETLLLASSLGGVARVWDLRTGRLRRTVESHARAMESAVWNGDGSTYASPAAGNSLEIRDAETGAVRTTLRGHQRPVVCVAWSPDGRTIATGGADASVRLWDVATGTPGRVLEGHTGYVQTLAFAPDGRTLASGSGDHDVRLWDVERGVGETLGSHALGVVGLRFSRDGTTLASGSADGTVRLWDVATKRSRAELGGHAPAVAALAFSPDGATIATAALGGRVRTWDARTGEERSAFDAGAAVSDVAWSPTGAVLAVAGPGILLRRVSDGATVWLRTFRTAGRDVGLVHTDDGLFAGDDEAFAHVHFRLGDDLASAEVVTADQLFESHHRADLLAALLEGRALEPPPSAREGVARPPSVEFVDATPATVMEPHVRVRVRATDRGGGVSEIRIFVNGARADEGRGGGFSAAAPAEDGGGLEKTVDVVLRPGDNEIAAEAYSERGRVRGPRAQRRVTLGAGAAADPPRLHVLAVTVDEYADPRQRLNFANEDGDAVAEALRRFGRPFAGVEVYRLRDREATRDRILALAERIRGVARPADTFVVYFAGHGMLARCAQDDASRYFFATQPARLEPASLCDVGLSALDVAGILRRVPAQRQILVLDTCQSGGAIDDLWTEVDLLKRLAREHGVAILAASKSTEVAGEVRELGHGLFTHAMLEGLRGGARISGSNEVSAYGLLAYVGREVDALSMRYFRRPQTVIASAQGRDFPLASVTP